MQLLGKTRHWPLHIDGTYKLTWQGFPVLISGITDVQHRFHPVSLSLVSHESTNAYLEVFTAQKEALWEESHRQLAPLFVIADGSPAITAASRMAFPEWPRAMCWAHVVRNVDKKTAGCEQREQGEQIQEGPLCLAACHKSNGVQRCMGPLQGPLQSCSAIGRNS